MNVEFLHKFGGVLNMETSEHLQCWFDPDVIIVGAGLMGCLLATELLRLDNQVKVLVLDAGEWFDVDHGQRNGRDPEIYDSLAHKRWSIHGDIGTFPAIEAVGGGALAWSGWCPTPRASELQGWPTTLQEQLVTDLLPRAHAALHVTRRPAPEGLAEYAETLSVRTPAEIAGPLIAPIALAAQGHVFSPLREFAQAARHHADTYRARKEARLQVLSACRLLSLKTADGQIRGARTTRGDLRIGDKTRVVLATNTVENARQALIAVPDNHRAGSRLSGHLLSDVAVRIPQKARHEKFEYAAFLIPGRVGDSHFHIQVHIGRGRLPQNADSFLWSRIPTLRGEEMFKGVDDEHAVVLLAALGEIDPESAEERSVHLQGDSNLPVLTFPGSIANDPVFDGMDDVIDDLCRSLWRPGTEYRAPGLGRLEWTAQPPERISVKRGGRRRDDCVHLSGALPMGDTPSLGATDNRGAVFGVDRLFAAGLCLFPRAGSHNGALAGSALTLKLAGELLSG